MSNNKQLVDFILESGKNESWLELANRFNIKVGSPNKIRAKAANDIWRNYQRQNRNNSMEESKNEKLIPVKAWFNGKEMCYSYKVQESKIDVKEVRKEFEDIVKTFKPDIDKIERFKYFGRQKVMLEISIPDPHLGKKSWEEETGDKYNLEIASNLFIEAVKHFLNTIDTEKYEIEKILFPIGNDFFNADGHMMTTTKGTPQHEDQNWKLTFRKGLETCVKAIELCKKYAKVDVIIVPGNHDRASCFYLGEALHAWYLNSLEVNIDNSPTDYKYYQYGQNMIYFNHGDEIKPDKIPLIMAVEQPKMFADCKFREAHLGDKHTDACQEYHGVKVRHIPSICATDTWHKHKGYVGNLKEAISFLWHPTKGNICLNYYNTF